MLFRRICPGCGGRGESGGPCAACVRTLRSSAPFEVEAPPSLDRLVVGHRYQATASSLILAAKNGGRRSLLRWFGGELATVATVAAAVDEVDVVTWVPASRQGVRQRGYDQGRLLGRSTALVLGASARRLLVRRPGPIRTSASREVRLVGPDLRCPIRVPASILLVDDVVTTGASLSAAAKALRRAGAERVTGLVVAVAGDTPMLRAFEPDVPDEPGDHGVRQHYG